METLYIFISLFADSKGDPLCILNSSSETDEHLLKMEYIKVSIRFQ